MGDVVGVKGMDARFGDVVMTLSSSLRAQAGLRVGDRKFPTVEALARAVEARKEGARHVWRYSAGSVGACCHRR